MTKVLIVSWGWDYANLTFDDSSYSVDDIINKMWSKNKLDLELDWEDIEFTLKEFEWVVLSDEFISLIKWIQDYDDSKNTWYYFIRD